MSGLGLGLGLGLGGLRVGDAGNMPATFTIAAGSVDDGVKRINFSEPVIVTITGDVTLSIGGIVYQSGDTIPVASSYHTLTINNPGAEAGTITFGKRKQITYLYLYDPGSSVITGDITGMKLTYLYLYDPGSSVITGDITGMELTYLYLRSLGSSVITGDITGMKLTYLTLRSLGSSVITGDITGMELTNLLLYNIGSSVVKGDITGMKLTYLTLYDIGSSVITGDITGMKLTYLLLYSLGSSVITGDITGMKLTLLRLQNIGSSVITGDITGMELTNLLLYNIGSSLTYRTNPLNITNTNGIQLLGNTVFATAAEYEQLIIDAAAATWGAATYPFIITAGTSETDPGWDSVKAHVAVLLTKAAWTIIPAAWLSANGGSWPADWNEYTGE